MQWITGIGSDKAAAPQGRLMATVITGILNQRLPWRLVAMGVFLVVAVELLGIRSLSFAVGSYLGLHTTLAIFCGGVDGSGLVPGAAVCSSTVMVKTELVPCLANPNLIGVFAFGAFPNAAGDELPSCGS